MFSVCLYLGIGPSSTVNCEVKKGAPFLMKKVVIVFIILLIILTGCGKQDNLPAKGTSENKPSVGFSNNVAVTSQQEQRQGIYKASVPYTQGEDLNEVANNLITMYLEHYKNTSDEQVNLKLMEYKIQKAEVYKSDEVGFMFNAIFSVLPVMDGAYLAGNGSIGENGWINDKCMFIKVIKINDTFQMEDWGTSP